MLGCSAGTDGTLAVLGERPDGDAFDLVLAWCGPDGTHVDRLDYAPMDGWPEHRPTLLAHPAGGHVVLPEPGRAFRHTGPGQWHELPVTGVEALASVTPAPRLHGGSAVSDTAEWDVVLAHGVLVQELRYTARFAIDSATGTASWHAPWTPDPADFPADRFGFGDPADPSDPTFEDGAADGFEEDDEPRAVSVTATLRRGGTTYLVSEGSDLGSVNGYGADFFTCAEVRDGRLGARPHEQSGWKRRPGKHGLRGRFTSDGTHLVLTPVFRTGEWKGRQRLLALPDGVLVEPTLPRGLTKATVLDRNGGVWWLRVGEEFLGLDGGIVG